MNFLIDHNIEGQALILLGIITSRGWLDLVPIRFISFEEMALPIDSSDMPPARYANELFGNWLKHIR